MNCGLGNLDLLKQHLLSSGTLAGQAQFDPVIASIGKGVAGLFDRFCNREFAYGENITETCGADRSHWYMRRFPYVSIAKVELRYFRADNWQDISGQPLGADESTGLLDFGYTLGKKPMRVRITYTGGYWFETHEPENDGDYPSPVPAAIANCAALEPAKFMLPEDVRLAWLLQCREVWSKIDKLGSATSDKPGEQSLTGALELAPMVKQALQGYVRYQIT